MLKKFFRFLNIMSKSDSEEVVFLKKVKIFKTLNNDELLSFSKYFLVRKFEPGEIIFRETYPHVVLYIIRSGEVELFFENDEKVSTIKNLQENKHFGEIGIFKETNRTASARAVKSTVLYGITKTDFIRYARKNSAVGVKLLFNIAECMADIIINSNEKIK